MDFTKKYIEINSDYRSITLKYLILLLNLNYD